MRMDLITLLKEYGWFVAILMWLTPNVWNFFAHRFFPQRMRERLEQERAEREARASLLKAQIEREERTYERETKIQERMAAAIETLSLGITAGNERMTALIASHTQHANFQFGSHIELKDRLDDIQDLIVYRNKVAELEKNLSDTQDRLKRVGGGE